MDINFREAKLKDAVAISMLAKETFPLACPKESDVYEIEAYCDKNLSLDAFQALILAQNSFVLCAYVNSELAGFAVLIFESDCPNISTLEKPVELQKFYVKSNFHGTLVTHQLMREATDVCIKRKYSDIWLGFFSNNERAKNFYAKFNFAFVGTINFIMGSETHLDNVMVAKIA